MPLPIKFQNLSLETPPAQDEDRQSDKDKKNEIDEAGVENLRLPEEMKISGKRGRKNLKASVTDLSHRAQKKIFRKLRKRGWTEEDLSNPEQLSEKVWKAAVTSFSLPEQKKIFAELRNIEWKKQVAEFRRQLKSTPKETRKVEVVGDEDEDEDDDDEEEPSISCSCPSCDGASGNGLRQW